MASIEQQAEPAESTEVRFAGGLLRGFAENIEFALIFIDGRGTISFVNAAALNMFGYSRDEMMGATLDLIIPQRLRGAHSQGIARIGAGCPSKLNGRTVEVVALRRDGTEFPIELSLSIWSGPDGVGMGGMIRDISERRQREARLHRLALHDALTGLPNRVQFDERLRSMLADQTQVAVLLLDLDSFKQVNDSLGHAAGDALLQSMAVRLPAALPPDSMLCRFGGDEFAVLLPGVGDPIAATACAEAILNAFAKPFTIQGFLLKPGVSIGIAIGPAHTAEAEELVACADLALYQSKQTGGRRFRLFEPSMRSAGAIRRALQDELLEAISKGQLELFYQPQVEIGSGDICGFEALLRWRHPKRGLLGPDAFLPVLETHSLAHEAGCWVLDEACRQVAEWRVLRPGVTVSVNLFAAQVNAGNLAEVVGNCLRRHRLPAAALELEVTETIVLENEERVLAPFQELKARGMRIAFDDFGTGHASLSMLKRFPLTTLKIDRSFIRDIETDSQDASIVKSLLTMCAELGLDAIAEGIETRGQEALLKMMGCPIGQGYLYARPLPAASFSALPKIPRAVGGAR